MRREARSKWRPKPAFEPLEARRLLSGAAEGQALQLFSASSALFVENQGQWADESVRYAFHGSGANVLFTDDGPIFQVLGREAVENPAAAPADPFIEPRDSVIERAEFAMSFEGGDAASPVGLDRTETVTNYVVGDRAHWRSGVSTYASVGYLGLYAGVDLRISGTRSNLKYEFCVAPGADWRQIAVSLQGIESLALNEAGDLVIGTSVGALLDAAPVIWQERGGERLPVAGQYRLIDEDTYGFSVTGAYDPSEALVIDPDLAWSTYLGGGERDFGRSIAVDGAGDVYVAGDTYADGWASGGFDTSHNGNADAFVAKLSPSGDHLWSTYLGGSAMDCGLGIAVDGAGDVYVTGDTYSAGWTSGGFDTSHNGDRDAFLVKLSPSGDHLWSTYLGGGSGDFGRSVVVDSAGDVYVAGDTATDGWASGGFDTSHNGGWDAFVAKLSPSGGHLWSTYLGGGSADSGSGIAVDGVTGVYVTGDAYSAGWVSGGFDTSHNGSCDAFVAKLSPSGDHLWSTYLGGGNEDFGRSIAVDGEGGAYVTGHTRSAGWASGGFDTSHDGEWDVFAARLSPSGDHLWSTYLGGTDWDFGRGITVDGAGDVYVAGDTYSAGWVSGGFDTDYSGACDAFAAKLSPSGGHLWSTYIGGTNWDSGSGLAADGAGAVYVTGYTYSADWTSGGFDTSHNGYADAFVAKIAATPPPVVTAIQLNGREGRTVSDIDPSGIGVQTVEVTFSKAVDLGVGAVTLETVTFPGGAEVVGDTLALAGVTGTGTDTIVIQVQDAWQSAVDTWVKVTLLAAAITDASGSALDGEPAADSTGLGYLGDASVDLPSGDGTAGGDAVFYVGSLRADMWGVGFWDPGPDGQITMWDVNGFTSKYQDSNLDADLWGLGFWAPEPDGAVTMWDVNAFTSLYQNAIASGTHLDDLPTLLAPSAGAAPVAIAPTETVLDTSSPSIPDIPASSDGAPPKRSPSETTTLLVGLATTGDSGDQGLTAARGAALTQVDAGSLDLASWALGEAPLGVLDVPQLDVLST